MSNEISENLEKINLNNTNEILPIQIKPIEVTYCDICTFPIEYCEYSHKKKTFKKALKAKEEQKKEIESLSEKKETTKETDGESAKPKEEGTTEVKETKKKKEKDNRITIKQEKRGKRKHTTYVANLEKFGLSIKDVAKLFSKKFACSSSVSKEDNGQEVVVLTGEFGYDIVEFLVEKFPNIKEDHCKVVLPKVKE